MIAALCVGAGGFVGAIARYLFCLLPYQGEFPLLTFVVNFVGSFLIGVVVEVAQARSLAGAGVNDNLVLFLKTGVCGGFTTFSTFSLETLTLLENGKYATGAAYAFGSLAVCVLGVLAGRMCARAVMGSVGAQA